METKTCTDLGPNNQVEELLQTLEQDICTDGSKICLYNGYWCMTRNLPQAIRFRENFKAHDTDILLCSKPKCGSTWLKALAFSIAKRHIYPVDKSPLLSSNPHKLVPFVDIHTYLHTNKPNIENIPSPRIFLTHVPYLALPTSVGESKCRIIYICRNPLDQFTSYRHFLLDNDYNKGGENLSMEQDFDKFCKGEHIYGPFWNHVLGYWEAYQNDPSKVLFLKYEDLKADIGFHVKKIGEFIGMPFSMEEEQEGVVEQIANLCSFDKLKSLEINKQDEKYDNVTKNSSFFRKGEVGGWANYVTPSMAKRFENILQSKLEGTGLSFNFS